MPTHRTARYAHPLTDAFAAARVEVLDPEQPLPMEMTAAVHWPHTFSEAAFQDQLLDLLRLYRWRVHHETDSRRSPGGLPDLICVRPPRVVVLELKAVNGILTELQRAWLADLAAADVEAGVAGPGDLPVLTHVLGRPGIRLPPYDPGGAPLLSPEQAREVTATRARRTRTAAAARRRT